MRYYKLKLFDESIKIDETELPRALYAQITGKVVILNNGSVAGNNIFSITPDYHRAMGWNQDYKLTSEDYNLIARDCADYNGKIGEAKQLITNAMKEGNVSTVLESGHLLLLN